MPRIHLCVIRQRAQDLVQSLVHFLCVALEEAPAAADEKRVACEDGFVGAVLEEIADAVLGVARRVERSDFDGADFECRVVGWGGCHAGAVLASDDGERILFELQGQEMWSWVDKRVSSLQSRHCRLHDHDG